MLKLSEIFSASCSDYNYHNYHNVLLIMASCNAYLCIAHCIVTFVCKSCYYG